MSFGGKTDSTVLVIIKGAGKVNILIIPLSSLLLKCTSHFIVTTFRHVHDWWISLFVKGIRLQFCSISFEDPMKNYLL